MSLAPLLEARPLILAHATAAFAALAVGTVQLLRRKGTLSHRALGWLWIALMTFVAGGSFGIHSLRQVGPFSWIHGLSAFTLATLALGIWSARTGRIDAHRWTMICLFVGALIVTGLFTLLPGRVMHQVVFGT